MSSLTLSPVASCRLRIATHRRSTFVFFTPPRVYAGGTIMLNISSSSRQPTRLPWTLERLVRKRAIALGNVLDLSTQQTYSSHLQSYLTFIKLHDFLSNPHPTSSLSTLCICPPTSTLVLSVNTLPAFVTISNTCFPTFAKCGRTPSSPGL